MTSQDVPNYDLVVSLVPQSGIQFLDFRLDVAGLTNLNRAFLEEELEDGGLTLTPLILRQGELRHPMTDEVIVQATHRPNVQRALEPFLGGWVPIPFMRVLGRDSDRRIVFDQGPSNWARAYVVPEEGASETTFRVVIAFDTEFDRNDRAEGRPYLMPNRTDVEGEENFAFSSADDDVFWFVNEPWVGMWLEEMFRDAERQRNPGARQGERPQKLEHIARYLAFLTVLELRCRIPTVRLVDTVSSEQNHDPIRVDLVIDVGNSRTCGILIESDSDDNDRPDLNKSYVLPLRDLSRPTQIHTLPFESRVEFARPSFGKDGISRRAGRANAFYWPSLVRIGPEAVRLSVGGAGTEGSTGMSSPKRYLWDQRPLNQVWRFRTPDARGAQEPAVSGPLMAFVTETGDVLRQTQRGNPALRPKFSKSALFTLFMTEVILQTLVCINSVNSRIDRLNKDLPRQLRNIIMTVPPGMPLAERRIMQRRVEGAIKLAWQALGWTVAAHAPPEPSVQIAFDEATCTQLVYLYAEIKEKLRGTPSDLFKILGRQRSGPAAPPTLRVASIDIGGGTTDLAVIEYRAEARNAIMPKELFRESIKVAGDDILQAVVGRHVVPAIAAHLTEKGLLGAEGILRGIVGADRGNQSQQERQFRRRFVTQICVPAALAILRYYETTQPFNNEEVNTTSLAALIGEGAHSEVVEDFQKVIAASGLPGVDVIETKVTFDADGIAATVHGVISIVISLLSEVVQHHGCDVVLLSGRPSRLPVVLDLIQSNLPSRPDRIIPMHQYHVGDWYPFRDKFNRISDPKTTVAVGALLCNLAEAQIEGFVLDKSRIAIRSTAHFIGIMDRTGVITLNNVLFSNIDLDGRKKASDFAANLREYLPVTIGFRQLDIERWPASPLYFLEYGNHANVSRLKRPLTVTIERADPDEDDPSRQEDFHVTELIDAEGTSLPLSEVSMRLQTLHSTAGYWLDTGIVETY